MSKKSDSKKELVDRAIAGDESAWSEIVELITPVILATCKSMRLSREETLDMFGQVCYLLLTNLKRIKSPDKLLSWTATVTRREVLATLRRSSLFDEFVSQEKTSPRSRTPAGPDDVLHAAEQAELLVRAIKKLPKRQGDVIWYLFLDERQLTYEEIAKKLRMPVASVGPTRQRALERLQTILRSMGYEF